MSATPIEISVGGSRTAAQWKTQRTEWDTFAATLKGRMRRN